MITRAFSVYDSKALCYAVPFFMPTVGAAVRAFSDLANDNQSMVCRHGSDYVLYEVGVFDDAKGVLTATVPYINLGTGADFIKRGPEPVRELVSDVKPTADVNGGSR